MRREELPRAVARACAGLAIPEWERWRERLGSADGWSKVTAHAANSAFVVV
jgi:hypothetical protein